MKDASFSSPAAMKVTVRSSPTEHLLFIFCTAAHRRSNPQRLAFLIFLV